MPVPLQSIYQIQCLLHMDARLSAMQGLQKKGLSVRQILNNMRQVEDETVVSRKTYAACQEISEVPSNIRLTVHITPFSEGLKLLDGIIACAEALDHIRS